MTTFIEISKSWYNALQATEVGRDITHKTYCIKGKNLPREQQTYIQRYWIRSF